MTKCVHMYLCPFTTSFFPDLAIVSLVSLVMGLIYIALLFGPAGWGI